MHWFLRFFPEYRDLEVMANICSRESEAEKSAQEELDSLRLIFGEMQQQNLRLQDRLDSATEDRGRLWDLMMDAQKGERESYRGQINTLMQRAGSGVPYPESHHLQAQEMPKPAVGSIGREGRILPSERAARASNQALRSIIENQASQ